MKNEVSRLHLTMYSFDLVRTLRVCTQTVTSANVSVIYAKTTVKYG